MTEIITLQNASPFSPSHVSRQSSQSFRPAEAENNQDWCTKLSYKTVKEIWDKKEYGYIIVDLPMNVTSDSCDEHIFVVRTRIEKSSKRETKYIDIQSHLLREVLRPIFENFRTVSLKEQKPSIDQKFLFHFLDDLRTLQKSLTLLGRASESSLHLNILLAHLEKEYSPTLERLNPLLEDNEITFDVLWTIFPPNSQIFTTCLGTGVPRCVSCQYVEQKKRDNGTIYLSLECVFLDFDGELFGEATTELTIESFRGSRKIHHLTAFPLAYHPDMEKMRPQLVECGRQFMTMLGKQHRIYDGKAFYVDEKGYIIIETIQESRIMIDPVLFHKVNPNYRRSKVASSTQFEAFDMSSLFCEHETKEEPIIRFVDKDPHSLGEDELLICNPSVRGYSLLRKMWLEFAVLNIADIQWNQTAFDQVTIPSRTKEEIRALCDAHEDCNSHLIEGKGQGLVALLHGPPGVGKTLTAEAVSEYLRRPLLSVSTGVLGVTAADLWTNLSMYLELTSEWQAIFLLDEVDIFIEKRDSSNLLRNALVCVFLQLLEYTKGIIFLATNRVEAIDPAVASRITMPIRYDDLSPSTREKIWKSHLRGVTFQDIPPQYASKFLAKLSEKNLNGRDIANSVKLARSLARYEESDLKFSHLERAAESNEQFQLDFKGGRHVESCYT